MQQPKFGSRPNRFDSGPFVDPGLVVQAALHLVGLLVVLVRPHVVGKRARQRIEGQLLQAIAERGIARNGQRLLERKHRLHDSTEFCSLRRIAARQVLVA